jgi:hypothetical protein
MSALLRLLSPGELQGGSLEGRINKGERFSGRDLAHARQAERRAQRFGGDIPAQARTGRLTGCGLGKTRRPRAVRCTRALPGRSEGCWPTTRSSTRAETTQG